MSISSMSARERVLAAFQGQEVDKPPLINPTSLANLDCMKISKAYYPYVHFNSTKMAALAATSYTVLKFDSVMPYFSVSNEVSALGADVDWGQMTCIPMVRSSVLKRLDQFQKPANYLDKRPIRAVIGAIRELKCQFGNDVAVIGKIVGPLSLAFYLHGVQDTLTSLILEPQLMSDVTNEIKDLCIEFALAQLEAGADIITISEDAAGDLISRNFYRDWVMDIEHAVNEAIQKYAFSIFHLSCDITDRVDLFAQTGFNALNFDSRNNLEIVKRDCGHMRLIGGVNNPVTLLNGGRTNVMKEVLFSLENGIHLISPECSIPVHVSNQNILAMREAVDQYAVRHHQHI